MRALLSCLMILFASAVNADECHGTGLVSLKDITNCAKQGSSVAQYMLGTLYFNGNEVPRNYKKAFEWISKAAEQGDKSAQSSLGFDYYNGWGVQKNHVLAYMWWSLSYVNEDEPITKKNLDDLENELSPKELAKAQDMASDWLAKHERKKPSRVR